MNDRIIDQAISWHEALAGEADWDGFTLWLEADPRHRLAYDEIAFLDDFLERNRAALASDAEAQALPERQGRYAWQGFAAACLVLLLLPALWLLRPLPLPMSPQHFASQAGAMRQLALADGTRIMLAPASSLDIANGGRELRLAGAATFDVVHRDGRELMIRAGGIAIADIGTRFEVSTAPGFVRIQVADGRLSARLADGQEVAVVAGRRLLVDEARDSAELTPFPVTDFAGWRHGRLVYDSAPLALVAADISRHSGIEVRLDTGLASRRFSGILTIGNGSGLVRNLAQIMALDIRPEGRSVRLVARGAGGRDPRPAG